jgi:hypothetical protein
LTLWGANYFHIKTICTTIYLFLTHQTAHYVQITTVCTVSYLLYWHTEMLIMFTSPQFAQSVTFSIDTPNCSLCSYHHNLHIHLLVFLTLRTALYFHNTTVSTVRYLFFLHSVLLIMFTKPKCAQPDTCSFHTLYCSLCSYHHSF